MYKALIEILGSLPEETVCYLLIQIVIHFRDKSFLYSHRKFTVGMNTQLTISSLVYTWNLRIKQFNKN